MTQHHLYNYGGMVKQYHIYVFNVTMSLIKYFSLENNVNYGMILFLNINEGLSLKKKKKPRSI
jgi:hypothetical protein